MDTRKKIISTIGKNEIIKHKGDLTIEGDVCENGEIHLTDGSLTILGNVKNNAKINIKLSEELRNITISSQLGSIISVNSGVTTYKGSYTSCNVMINNTMIGNVNIDNRIFTNDQVIKLSKNKYKITPISSTSSVGFLFQKSSSNTAQEGFTTATIDGKQYQGKEIIVEGKDVFVFVDGHLVTASGNTNNVITEKPSEPPKFIIHGQIENLVSIHSDAAIEVKGNIGKFCQIESEHAGLTAKNIGEATNINVRNKITVETVDDQCSLMSKQYGLTAKNLKNKVMVDVRDAIEIRNDIGDECHLKSHQYGLKADNVGNSTLIYVRDAINLTGNIGDKCNLTSNQYGLSAYHVGSNVTINVRDAIKVRNIGDKSSLTSTQDKLSAHHVGNNVQITTRDGINLNGVGNRCTITSQQDGIDVTDDIGEHVHLICRENIMAGRIGSHSQLISHQGKIRISNNAGAHIILKSRESISAKDIGDNSTIISSTDEVNVINVGSNVTIQAKEDINIDGYCPPNAILTTQKGKIRKAKIGAAPQQPVNAPQEMKEPKPISAPSPVKMPQFNVNHYIQKSNDDDLQKAIALSQAELVKKQGLFAIANEKDEKKEKEKEIDIPSHFLCVISDEIMEEPVICTLDGRTYEKKNITKWLMENRTAPYNRAPMKPNQQITDVLVVNFNLKEGIDAFRQENPSLFAQNSNKM
jgi:hypothetical protein